MSVNPLICILGSDRSSHLVEIAYSKHVKNEDKKTSTPVEEIVTATKEDIDLEEKNRDQLKLINNNNNNNNNVNRQKNKKKNNNNNNEQQQQIQQQRYPGTDAMVADGLSLPFPLNSFDFVISIAVIHHFSTKERRIEAVKEILNRLKPNSKNHDNNISSSKALIYVWALEQESSRRGYHEGMDQDVMVPWVTKKNNKNNKNKKNNKIKTKDSGTDCIHETHDIHDRNDDRNDRCGEEEEESILNPENKKNKPISKEEEDEKEDTNKTKEIVKHRYYHLYKKGELENDVLKAGGQVIESGYSRDNWYAIITRI